jgi:hypothetical protein
MGPMSPAVATMPQEAGAALWTIVIRKVCKLLTKSPEYPRFGQPDRIRAYLQAGGNIVNRSFFGCRLPKCLPSSFLELCADQLAGGTKDGPPLLGVGAFIRLGQIPERGWATGVVGAKSKERPCTVAAVFEPNHESCFG